MTKALRDVTSPELCKMETDLQSGSLQRSRHGRSRALTPGTEGLMPGKGVYSGHTGHRILTEGQQPPQQPASWCQESGGSPPLQPFPVLSPSLPVPGASLPEFKCPRRRQI